MYQWIKILLWESLIRETLACLDQKVQPTEKMLNNLNFVWLKLPMKLYIYAWF